MRPYLHILFALLLTTAASAQEKRPLDHDAFDIWNRTHAHAISPDGQWIFYSIGPEEKDAELHIQHLHTDSALIISRGETIAFSNDARHLIALIKAPKDAVKQARRDKKKSDDMPKDSLGIATLTTGHIAKIARVKSYKMPKEGSGYLAYLLEKATPQKDTTSTAKKEEKTEPKSEPSPLPETPKPIEEKKPAEPSRKKKDKTEGAELVLRNLHTGEETRYAHVIDYHFSENGAHLIYAAASKDSTADGLYAIRTATRDSTAILTGPGDYKRIAIDKAGTQIAFLANRDSFLADQPEYALYHWRIGTRAPRQLARSGMPGIPEGWWVSEHGTLSFSRNGTRLFFGTAPRPEPEPDAEIPDDEKVIVDIWHWRDDLLQPMQLKDLQKERDRTYQAVIHLRNNRIVQLATENIPDIRLGDEGNADIVLGITAKPYQKRISWQSPAFYDTYLIDTRTGQQTPILTKNQARPEFSPKASHIFWWDGTHLAYIAQHVKTGNRVTVTAGIPHPVHNELHDVPNPPHPHGHAGWTEDDNHMLIYDRFDIHLADPRGKNPPRNLTRGLGRQSDIRFRYVRLDPEERAIDPKADLLLSAFNLTTKAEGFYRHNLSGNADPMPLYVQDKKMSAPQKPKRADGYLFTQSSFADYPDLWFADPHFQTPRKLTTINPQQKNYRWGTSERVQWTSLDGASLQGILCKPDDFDPARQYPMIVFFYEKMSDHLHTHWIPTPGRSVINMSFFVSRDYLIFMPDIPYKIGYPGESAVNAIVPGVTHLIDQGFVNKDRIGIIGHSWSGYQTLYILTRTHLFRAAEAGAPVANMTSAYGGIRWGSGLSRMMQYETGQSRIGGSLWEYPMRYIENSPLFQADKIQTPLLMMHNDSDGAVPWTQGIELFTALRRLDKPVWLINYNGEDHGLSKYQNRKDWAIRLQQFFDHHLKDVPAPHWMTRGIPAIEKGKTLGLDID